MKLILIAAIGLFLTAGCKKITEIFSSDKTSASSLKEGTCLMNPSMPNVVLKLKGIGDQIVSFESNVTGSLLSQYDKALLEDEIKVGTTVVTSCELFDQAQAN